VILRYDGPERRCRLGSALRPRLDSEHSLPRAVNRRDAGNGGSVGDQLGAGPVEQLSGSSNPHGIATRVQHGFTTVARQTLRVCDEVLDFITRFAVLVPKP
jgi:hypothetical protein